MQDKNEFNAYVGYVMPILTYCSQTLAPNTTHCKSIERVQKTAMRWIAPTESTYKKRLLLTQLLPVTLYLELHDLLYLLRRTDCSTTENQENDNSKTTRQHARGERIIPKYRLQKTNDNFPYRAKKLLNAVIKSLSNTAPDEILKPTKSTLSNFFWSYFKEVWRIHSLHLAYPVQLWILHHKREAAVHRRHRRVINPWDGRPMPRSLHYYYYYCPGENPLLNLYAKNRNGSFEISCFWKVGSVLILACLAFPACQD